MHTIKNTDQLVDLLTEAQDAHMSFNYNKFLPKTRNYYTYCEFMFQGDVHDIIFVNNQGDYEAWVSNVTRDVHHLFDNEHNDFDLENIADELAAIN